MRRVIIIPCSDFYLRDYTNLKGLSPIGLTDPDFWLVARERAEAGLWALQGLERAVSFKRDGFWIPMSALDRQTLLKFSSGKAVKSYAATVAACALGATLVFCGLAALIETRHDEQIASKPSSRAKMAAAIKQAGIIPELNDSKAAAMNKHTDRRISDSLTGSAFVNGTNAPIRATPAINGRILECSAFGTNVELIAQEGKWVKVHSPDRNISGWIERAYLSF